MPTPVGRSAGIADKPSRSCTGCTRSACRHRTSTRDSNRCTCRPSWLASPGRRLAAAAPCIPPGSVESISTRRSRKPRQRGNSGVDRHRTCNCPADKLPPCCRLSTARRRSARSMDKPHLRRLHHLPRSSRRPLRSLRHGRHRSIHSVPRHPHPQVIRLDPSRRHSLRSTRPSLDRRSRLYRRHVLPSRRCRRLTHLHPARCRRSTPPCWKARRRPSSLRNPHGPWIVRHTPAARTAGPPNTSTRASSTCRQSS